MVHLLCSADVPPARSNTSAVRASPSAVPMPRVMFSTPEARPDWRSGTDPMIAALLGGVKQPRPAPISARRTRKPSVAGRRAPRAKSPIATSDIPPTVSGRAPRRSARRPANGATMPEGERHHHELEAGARRAEPEPTLEVEGHEEEDAEHDQVGQEPTGDAPAEPGAAEEREVEHRLGDAALPEHEGAPRGQSPRANGPMMSGEVQP